MIDILMATHNGEAYLRQQIDSILSQSNQEWQLLIRDDGSQDNTVDIIEEYVVRYPEKIRLIRDDGRRLGTSLNFGRLLDYSHAKYVMFSDQDDIWLPKKIELTMKVMQAAEEQYGNSPILVHTDLKVVDSNLSLIADSLWRYQKFSPEFSNDLNSLMVQNVVTGCAMMMNKKARDVSIPLPEEAIMHDWWIAIRVAMEGKIVYVSVPSVLYRQHSKNKVGAEGIEFVHFAKRVRELRRLVASYYRMLKRANPKAGFCILMLKKVIISMGRAMPWK